MSNKFVAAIVLLLLAGCSKPPTPAPVHSSLDRTHITMVETAETRERSEIKANVKALLVAKKYDDIDKLAVEYRDSKKIYADGHSENAVIYSGTDLDEEASDAEWQSHLEALHNWIHARPESIAARISLADALVSYAWKARGSGYADTVSREGWKLMGERLAQAGRILQDAELLADKSPSRWNELMTVALGLNIEKEEYYDIFRKAIIAEPDFRTSYYLSMAYALLPRWYGSEGEMEKFVTKSADEIGGDDGDVLYARCAWELQQSVLSNVFTDSKLSWERTDKGLQVLETRYPDSLYLQNARALLALMGSKTVRLPRLLITGLNGQIDPKVWTSKEEFIRLTNDL